MMNYVKKKDNWWITFKKNWQLLLLCIPGLIIYILFDYVPMFGVVMAFKKYRYNLGIFGSEWCGFDNFRYLFDSVVLWRITMSASKLAFPSPAQIRQIKFSITKILFIHACRFLRHIFFLTFSNLSHIVFYVTKKRERTSPATVRSFSNTPAYLPDTGSCPTWMALVLPILL